MFHNARQFRDTHTVEETMVEMGLRWKSSFYNARLLNVRAKKSRQQFVLIFSTQYAQHVPMVKI